MKLNKVLALFAIIVILIISFENVYAEELEIIEVEVKYFNGDRADFTEMKFLVYQDSEKIPILEKELEGNPDFITLPINHKYKIEVYANGMYADIEYIELEDTPKKINIDIPLSGGLQFEIYYKDGSTPIKGATVVLKSYDNSELRRGLTNDLGETVRYWIQSTTKQGDHYIADVYLEDIFLTSYFPIQIQPGLFNDQKIVTNIPEIVEELITINLFSGSKKITSKDGDYKVILTNLQANDGISANVNSRGDANFSSLKSGSYEVKIITNEIVENILWPQKKIHIIGDLNKFSIFKNSESTINQDKSYLSCNCISFRLDDIQDYWLADTQIELINLFIEKDIPLTIGVIGSLIGEDERITSVLEENIANGNIEVANHSWNNDVLTEMDKNLQEQYILDTNEQIFEKFGVTPTSFIPPENLYDENTVEILKNNRFTHLSSHIDENESAHIDEDLFYKIPAVTQTAILEAPDFVEWKLTEKEEIKEEIIQSINQNGYAVVMMHPQEFSLNDEGEYDIPNQQTLSNLGSLLDEIAELDSKIITMNKIGISEQATEETPEQATEETPEQATEEEQIDTCNCVAFRLDDVQDYWLNDVQIKIMKTFTEKNTPLTIGIIGNAFGNDQKITEFVKQNMGKYLEVATRGMGLTPFTNYNKIEQNENLKESLDLIELSINERPKIFIPPDNKFNSDTFEILEENNITHISSSLTNGDSPPFDFKDKTFYRFPQITSTGEYNPLSNIFEGISNQQIIFESIQGINNYGFSVVSIHFQEFTIIENSTYSNSVNEKQIDDLIKLIDEFNEKGYKIVPIGKINSNLIVLLPEWIKNNAGWWAEGQIDDKTFVQGIEYLVQENIITVSEKSQTATKQNMPPWIKNNAGWWAEGQIDDKTFVQGIEYLVKNGIITY